MLRCREVVHLVASDNLDRVGLVRRLELRLHLMMCRHCRNYVRQVGLIGAAARRIWGNDAADAEVTAAFEQRVLNALRAARNPKPGR